MSARVLLDQLGPDARAAALAVLDEISRPMTNIEIDDALRGILPRRQRRALVGALRDRAVIAIE